MKFSVRVQRSWSTSAKAEQLNSFSAKERHCAAFISSEKCQRCESDAFDSSFLTLN